MFAARCDDLGQRVLVLPSDIEGISNHDGVILVEYRCVCGADGLMVTGRGVTERCGHLASMLTP